MMNEAELMALLSREARRAQSYLHDVGMSTEQAELRNAFYLTYLTVRPAYEPVGSCDRATAKFGTFLTTCIRNEVRTMRTNWLREQKVFKHLDVEDMPVDSFEAKLEADELAAQLIELLDGRDRLVAVELLRPSQPIVDYLSKRRRQPRKPGQRGLGDGIEERAAIAAVYGMSREQVDYAVEKIQDRLNFLLDTK